jgi:Mg2+ and Co2+ transporter CorA
MSDKIAGEEKVPLFPKWSYWYALVIGVLILLIIFFYFLTKHFS